MLIRRRILAAWVLTSRPSTQTLPVVGDSKAVRILKRSVESCCLYSQRVACLSEAQQAVLAHQSQETIAIHYRQ
jgi:hypothetical protein